MKKYLITLTICAFFQSANSQPLGSASVDQIVEKLEAPQGRTRGLRNLAPAPRSLDLVIQFDFDSAKIQETSKPLLNNLAAAMMTEKLEFLNFVVEGHTDAKGTADYNLRLSERRAEAVVNYMRQRGVSKQRLNAQGKGANDLLNPESPEALENRRVRITTVQ
jgi:outer membrane protein OmpA-like peptidoglycan-associated protein